METPVTRRLAAILAADVAGYSRLMGADEPRTVAALRSHRGELTDPTISEHHGRIVNTAGDSILAEFASVVDAVRCAEAIQRGMAARNADLPTDQRIVFRIGINLGDVISQGTEIYGDGVNVAARLEGICDPSGIAIGRNVYEQVHDKLPYAWQDAGTQHLKNIAEPVRVYRWKPGAVAPVHPYRAPRRWRLSVTVAAVALVLAGGGWVGLRFLPQFTQSNRPPRSLVVLPLDNLSQDPDQDYFVDALTEDLITDLSRIDLAMVIARNTSFTYKGKAVDVKAVARELNVRYVLEGSVQRQGREVRVTLQLIDGETGAHLWAERFDRPVENLFALQNEVTGRVANSLSAQLLEWEARRAQQGRGGYGESGDLSLRAWALLNNRAFTPDLQRQAMPLFEKALALDAENVAAWLGVSNVHLSAVGSGFSANRTESLRLGMQAAQRAVQLDPRSAIAYGFLEVGHFFAGQLDESLAAADTCIALNRNLPFCHTNKALALVYLGRSEESLPWSAKAIELNPRDPQNNPTFFAAALAHLLLGQDKAAIAAASKGVALNALFPFNHLVLAAAYGNLGELAFARDALAKGLKLVPNGAYDSIAKIKSLTRSISTNPAYLAQRERYVYPGLRKAGLPEE